MLTLLLGAYFCFMYLVSYLIALKRNTYLTISKCPAQMALCKAVIPEMYVKYVILVSHSTKCTCQPITPHTHNYVKQVRRKIKSFVRYHSKLWKYINTFIVCRTRIWHLFWNNKHWLDRLYRRIMINVLKNKWNFTNLWRCLLNQFQFAFKTCVQQ